jgi:hypothetical protein
VLFAGRALRSDLLDDQPVDQFVTSYCPGLWKAISLSEDFLVKGNGERRTLFISPSLDQSGRTASASTRAKSTSEINKLRRQISLLLLSASVNHR